MYWCQIHERAISLRFLFIILRDLRLAVSVYNDYIANQFQTTFWNPLVEVNVNSKGENSEDFSPNYVKEFGLCTILRFHMWQFLPIVHHKGEVTVHCRDGLQIDTQRCCSSWPLFTPKFKLACDAHSKPEKRHIHRTTDRQYSPPG